MANAIAASWLNMLSAPAPAAKPSAGRTGKSTSNRFTPEAKKQLALRICNQSYKQAPHPSDDDVLDRLKDEAGLSKPVARSYLINYKLEAGIPVDKM